jgi:hypothetical protein
MPVPRTSLEPFAGTFGDGSVECAIASATPMGYTARMTEAERLAADISRLFFKLDPIGINFDDNTDEYDPEAAAIVARLPSCRSVDDVTAATHAVFVAHFDGDIAGPIDGYRVIAAEVWRLWQANR